MGWPACPFRLIYGSTWTNNDDSRPGGGWPTLQIADTSKSAGAPSLRFCKGGMTMQTPRHNVLYTLPEASTSFLKPPSLQRIAGVFRKSPAKLTISYRVKGAEQISTEDLQFIEPLAHAVYSLFTVPEFASVAYDKVIQYEDSDWLKEVRARIASRPTKISTSDLRHLAVMFDDGPYYEFICRDFAHVRGLE